MHQLLQHNNLKFFLESSDIKSNVDDIKKFIIYCLKQLKIDKCCKVVLCSTLPTETSFAYYAPNELQEKRYLKVCYKNRNLADVLRSIAHELVHYKQDLLGVLDENSGLTGSNHENQANSLAGIFMRDWVKEKPQTLKILLEQDLLGEANSGIQSNKEYKKYTNLVKKVWTEILNKLPNNIPLVDLLKGKKYNSILLKKSVLQFKLGEHTVYCGIRLNLVDNKILNEKNYIEASYDSHTKLFLLEIHQYNPQSKNFNNDTVSTGLFGKDYHLFLKKTVADILKSPRFNEMADHETSHFYNLTVKNKEYNKDHSMLSTDSDKFDYLSSPEEVTAFISQIITSIKKTKETDLYKFLKSNDVWKSYEKYVFPKKPKLKNKMLSKIANAWKNF